MEETIKRGPGRPPKTIETTPMNEARQTEAERYRAIQPSVKQEWYDFIPARGGGRKVILRRMTENGVTSDYVGIEKKLPKELLEKIKKQSH